MATYKSTSSDYIITVDGGQGTLTINANVDIAGNVTYIDSQELVVQDPFIILNNSNTGSYVSNSGVLTHTANTTYAGIRYNRTDVAWEITNSTDATGLTGTWSAIATTSAVAPGQPNTSIQFNVANSFAGSSNFLFDSGNSKVSLTGLISLGNIGTAPSATGNAVALYHNEIGQGGTGVYVKSPVVEDEVCSKTKAIVFSLIF